MTAAILISGYLRSYDDTINFVKNEVFKKFDKVDVYIHITKNENTEDKYYNLINEDEDIKKIIKELNPISLLIEDNENYSDNPQKNNIINQWLKLYKLNEIKKSQERLKKQKYDVVIRHRPDLSIKGENIFNDKIESNTIYIPNDSKIDKIKLSDPNDLFICDAFAYGDSSSMNQYFDIYENILDSINHYGYVSETILYHHLTSLNISIKKIDIEYSLLLSKCNVFAICGDSGSGKTTLSRLLKKCFSDSFTLECDRYHKWERGNTNWDSITHLNPKANHIEKMSEDVFNLKIGKDIFQVDYDHKTGKFTEKQQINPANNLIVCGLHTIYDSKTNSIYDIKIFMDPQRELKEKWKIIRDVKERGYDIKKVLESIKKRREDYNKFILPQKNNADIVVKFFSQNKIDTMDLNHEDTIGLQIILNKDFNIDIIINELTKHNIKHHLDVVDTFTITFKEYEPIKIGDISTNSFYDYVILIIFNLSFTK
jgi:uridine kinase